MKWVSYSVNNDVKSACFTLPENYCQSDPVSNDTVNMLNSMRYALHTINLGKIVRIGLRREWSFLCDAFVTVFGKISNFDVITSSLLDMLFILINDQYFNFGELLLIEISAKLRSKNQEVKISTMLDF